MRFAPSPTGYLHIGGARTALFNWLFARHHHGKFVLRIEDTDQARSQRALADALARTMQWLGLDWDEGPFFQSERLELYRKAADQLVASGQAYRCYCTREELAERREEAQKAGRPFRYEGRCRHLTEEQEEAYRAEGRPYVLRLKVDENQQTVVHDLIRGDVVFDHQTIDDFIIMKSDGMPAYNFAVVVDDADMKISHVIRAEEHLSNTPKQLLVYRALGLPEPYFAHVPMILAPDRSKLSKRHGAVAVEEFEQKGYLPEAILNYLALLGWSPGDDRELMSLDELIQLFSLERVNKTAAIYDVEKMTWMNGQYLRALPVDELADRVLPRFQEAGYVSHDPSSEELAKLKAILVAVRERVRTLSDLVEASDYFYRPVTQYDPKGVRKHFQESAAALLEEAAVRLADLEDFRDESIESLYRQICEEKQIGTGKLFHPTRLALSGRTMGPSLFEMMEILGRDTCVQRLKGAAEQISAGILN